MIKKLKSIIIKIYIKAKERRFNVSDQVLKYIFLPSRTNSKRLIVVFSGFAGHNVPGKYNYVRTLNDNMDNKLFILDDFGYKSVGSYYLGNNFELYQLGCVEDLIDYIKRKSNAKELIFVGSSKGASAALIYGLKLNIDKIICASPQYHIAQYLHQNEYHECILNSIIDESAENEVLLDQLIDRSIDANEGNTEIDMLYSDQEASFKVDVRYLIDSIEKKGLRCKLQNIPYTEHSDTGKYFIPFLKKTLNGEN